MVWLESAIYSIMHLLHKRFEKISKERKGKKGKGGVWRKKKMQNVSVKNVKVRPGLDVVMLKILN